MVPIVMKTLPTASTSEQLPQLELCHLTLLKASQELKRGAGGKDDRRSPSTLPRARGFIIFFKTCLSVRDKLFGTTLFGGTALLTLH